ncbi:unnamed protein product, partial [Heterosigma akashiwo]
MGCTHSVENDAGAIGTAKQRSKMSKSYRDQQADDAASFLSQNHGLSSKVQISIE